MIIRIQHGLGPWATCLLLCGWVAVWSGCGDTSPPQFVLNLQGRVPSEVPREEQQAVVDALTALFGTPDKPYIFSESGLDLQQLQLAAGATWSDEQGYRRGLYRRHCAHCHGVTGDGDGPTARFLDPYPRDYRMGKFKFTSTRDGAKATVADLKRTLIKGIPGTAMPSFALLPEDEVDALVEYVKYLSIRGETETLLWALSADGENLTDRETIVGGAMEPIVGLWNAAESQIVVPELRSKPVDTPKALSASIAAGSKLFQSGRAQCVKCHGPTALGDGSRGAGAIFDDWNMPKVDFAKAGKSGAELAALTEKIGSGYTPPEVLKLWDLPIQRLKPRNLHLGIYRGGRRPLDLYRRIYAGIKGANMPAGGALPGDASGAKLSSDEIWQLVDYVRSLPYDSINNPAAASPHTAHLAHP